MRIPASTGWLSAWLVLAPVLAGCAAFPQAVSPRPMSFPAVPATVFIANGAGNFQMTTKAFRNVLQADGYPIEVITHEWSHGTGKILKDQLDYPHTRQEGAHLAQAVQAFHADHPDTPIYLLGHSAGSTVILSALEHLPPQIVERAVLLSPSVSAYYDVRPALRAVKQDLFVFYSRRDCFYLGVVTRVVGTSDRQRTATAGCVGFRVCLDADEPELARKLVQRPWDPTDRNLGNRGGHFDCYQPDFLRSHIIPLLNPRPTFAKVS